MFHAFLFWAGIFLRRRPRGAKCAQTTHNFIKKKARTFDFRRSFFFLLTCTVQHACMEPGFVSVLRVFVFETIGFSGRRRSDTLPISRPTTLMVSEFCWNSSRMRTMRGPRFSEFVWIIGSMLCVLMKMQHRGSVLLSLLPTILPLMRRTGRI